MKICVTGDSILMRPLPEGYPGFEAVSAHIAQGEKAPVRVRHPGSRS